jgi:hypothetical protein
MSDLPFALEPALAASLSRALDVEGKIPRALEALGPIVGRDVVLVGGGPLETRRLTEAGVRLTSVNPLAPSGTVGWSLPDGQADAVVAAWSGFRGIGGAELAETERVLRPGGRLLIVHDYGRDDVSRLRGDRPAYGDWSRRDGPFLSNGFRVRVVHSFWTFDTLEAARALLTDAFGPEGVAVGATLKRPRLSWNIALYHRTRGADAAAHPAAAGANSG